MCAVLCRADSEAGPLKIELSFFYSTCRQGCSETEGLCGNVYRDGELARSDKLSDGPSDRLSDKQSPGMAGGLEGVSRDPGREGSEPGAVPCPAHFVLTGCVRTVS